MAVDPLPLRVRLLVLGGGIHGVGVLHDMATRGWRDILLVERARVGCATTSRTTKLIHGGLRYLAHPGDLPYVRELLRERKLLMNLHPDLIKPVEFLLPLPRRGGVSATVMRAGLALHGLLAGRDRILAHRRLRREELTEKAPMLNPANIGTTFSFWDAMTDDLVLARRVANSARELGATIAEGCEAISARRNADGWTVEIRRADGTVATVSALYVINALGPWAGEFLDRSELPATHEPTRSRSTHIILGDLGLKSALMLESTDDRRFVFVVPWAGHTLIGTTEELFEQPSDSVAVASHDVEYLLNRCNRFLLHPIKQSDVKASFAALRWLAAGRANALSRFSRAHDIGEHPSQRGLLMTLYGGTLTTYRSLAKAAGDRIMLHFGEFMESRTHEKDAWVAAGIQEETPPPVLARFK